jgi:hypothetical protein
MSEWRALSFSQPWLDLVMRAARGEPQPKLVENRRWRTHLRGPFILHAALSYDSEAEGIVRAADLGLVRARSEMPRGGFVGVARLLDVLERQLPGTLDLMVPGQHDLRWWAREQFGFLLAEDVRELPFVPYPGSLNFWKVPAPVVAQLGLPPTPEAWL